MWCARLAPAAAVLLLLATGCDPTVEPFNENDLHYSIFSYLHVGADTQFVRVEPLRDGLPTRAPETMDVQVELTDLTTGQTVALRDSLFHYLGDAAVHNYYATVAIAPTAAYRLIVNGPEDTESRAQTQVPDTFPTPIVREPMDFLPDCDFIKSAEATIAIRDIERLVAVKTVYHINEPALSRETHAVGHLEDTTHVENGVIEAQIDYGRDWCELKRNSRNPEDVFLEKIEVVVAAGSPDWPDYVGLDLETEMLPGVTSNVEGGVGLFGGVATDTVVIYPYRPAE